ncbi:putative transposase [Escherichia coli N1]|nr:putative transposase [Escherichia coli N1]
MQKAIHKALDECSTEHQDEVDIHLHLKISTDWQLRGQKKRVVTLG